MTISNHKLISGELRNWYRTNKFVGGSIYGDIASNRKDGTFVYTANIVVWQDCGKYFLVRTQIGFIYVLWKDRIDSSKDKL